jgi:hypothetical protein
MATIPYRPATTGKSNKFASFVESQGRFLQGRFTGGFSWIDGARIGGSGINLRIGCGIGLRNWNDCLA